MTTWDGKTHRGFKRRFKITSLGITDKQLAELPFGRQLEYLRKIQAWKEGAEYVWLSQKRRSHAAAFKEFRAAHPQAEYFYEVHDSREYRDDTFQVFYKEPSGE